jgi:hypothetical protein
MFLLNANLTATALAVFEGKSSIEDAKGNTQSSTQAFVCALWDATVECGSNVTLWKEVSKALRDGTNKETFKAISGQVSKVRAVRSFVADGETVTVEVETASQLVDQAFDPATSDVAFSTVYREVQAFKKERAELAEVATKEDEAIFEAFRRHNPDMIKLTDKEIQRETGGQAYIEGVALLDLDREAEAAKGVDDQRVENLNTILNLCDDDGVLKAMILTALT